MKLFQISTIEQLRYVQPEVQELAETLIKKTGSKLTFERLMKIILSNLNNPSFRMFVVIDDKFKVMAYYIIQLGIDDDSGEMMAFVYHHASKEGLMPEINKQLDDIFFSLGCKIARFITKRNTEAFSKSLGGDWKITGSVMEKELKGV